jgi:hypothetical protein
MAITTLNNLAINRSDTAAADQLWTATSATATDFQAAAAGGALIRLGTTADAGSGSPAYIDFTSVFSSTYNVYKLFVSDIEFVDDTYLEVSFLVGGTEQTAGSYLRKSGQMYAATGTNSQQWEATNNSDGWLTTGNWGAGRTLDFQGNLDMTLFDPNSNNTANEVFWTANVNQASQMILEWGGGYYNTLIAATGIRLKPHSGNWVSGVINLYGLKNS